MKLQVFRVRFYDHTTIGQLYVNGVYFCFTLEDKMRQVDGEPVEKWKVPNETAIPTGTYKVTLENSGKFGPDTMTINDVPGYTYVRIHPGNTDKDTEGCLIIGYKLNDDNTTIHYGTTRTAVNDLKQQVRKAISDGEDVTIEIRNVR